MNFDKIVCAILCVILMVVIIYSIFFNANDESIICRSLPLVIIWTGVGLLAYFYIIILTSMYHLNDTFEYPYD